MVLNDHLQSQIRRLRLSQSSIPWVGSELVRLPIRFQTESGRLERHGGYTGTSGKNRPKNLELGHMRLDSFVSNPRHDICHCSTTLLERCAGKNIIRRRNIQ